MAILQNATLINRESGSPVTNVMFINVTNVRNSQTVAMMGLGENLVGMVELKNLFENPPITKNWV